MKMLHFVEGTVDCKPEEASFDPKALENLEDHLRTLVLGHNRQAAGYLLARNGKVFAHSAMGSLHHDAHSSHFHTDSIHRISGITAVFTIAAAWQQIEKGRLDMDQDVSRFLPEFAAEGLSSLRIGHLLTQTSGIEAFPNPWVAGQDNPVFQHLQDPAWIAKLVERNPSLRPGERWGYSPLGLSLLARIIEIVSDRPFEDLVLTRIAAPLGMDDTSFDVTGTKRERMCTIGAEPPIGTRGGAPRGGAGLYSTMTDLHRFANLFLEGSQKPSAPILSRATREAMLRNHSLRSFISRPEDFSRRPLYSGWMPCREDLPSLSTFGMEGWGWSSVYVDPTHAFTCIFFLPGKVEFNRIASQQCRAIVWGGLR